ncbi:MAG: hypothetical protein OXQ93_00480 [Gemmatimonadota bacterium]|nr:hypothetical protein [Gemmatimonadota bacterium]
MPELALFRPADSPDAAERLASFIRHARDDLTVFGADLDWDAPAWELRGVDKVSGRPRTPRANWGHPVKKAPRSPDDYVPLDPRNVDFFKTCLRYRFGLAPRMNVLLPLTAIRLLDRALSVGGRTITEARCDEFNAAAAACRSAYSLSNSYRVGLELQAIGRFLDDHGLVLRPLAWVSPIRRPTSFDRIGAGPARRRARKLPSERAIAALGEAYRRAGHPMDVIAVCAYALLLAGHGRISELHRLDAYDCEVEVMDGGRKRYGLRWRPSKGGQPETRWIPTALVPLAKEALRRLREVTEPARELARKYAAGESILPRNDPGDPFARDSWISRKGLQSVAIPQSLFLALRRKGFDISGTPAGNPHAPRALLYPRARIEEGLRAYLPRGFPVADAGSGLDCRRALLIRTGSMSVRSKTLFWRLSLVTSDEIEQTMNGSDQGTGGLFRRLGLLEDDGGTVRITPHQLRHYMTTLANEGGLSQLDIASWAGRGDVRHNACYDHETAASLVDKARRVDEDLFGAAVRATPRRPVDAGQLMRGVPVAVHLTKYGACLHDFSMSPCPVYRDCLNCVEHACVKGDRRAEKALRERLAIMERSIAAAARAAAAGEPSSAIWLSRKQVELARLRELAALIDDETIPEGAVLTLDAEARYAVDRDAGGLCIAAPVDGPESGPGVP